MLYYKIKELYPDISDKDFSLRDDGDGKGAYIAEWKSTVYPQPTASQLASVKPSVRTLLPSNKEKMSAVQYLESVNWMYIRKLMTGKDVPAEVQAKVAAAYTKINEGE